METMSLARILRFSTVGIFVAGAVAFAADDSRDLPGSGDHPRISRFKGSVIVEYKASDFGQIELLLSRPGPKQKSQNVEGRLTRITYKIPKGHDSHEVYRSYETELAKGGFETLYKCAGEGEKECGSWDFPSYMQTQCGCQMGLTEPASERFLAARRHTPAGDTFVMLYGYSQMDQTRAILSVVDVGPLNKGLVTVSAEALARDITTEGHAIVYGVYFDTDSATIKPESDSALKEMAKLLSQDASLKVFIVGHTDNVGLSGHNLDLSQKRAEAVVKTLVTKHHIDAKRLEGRGVGPLAPVAANRTEVGRAKNRRVELVEK